MPISQYVSRSMEEGGWIRRMFEVGIALKAQYGADNVFDLSLGNPVMEPPPEFHAELRRIAEHPVPGMHRYMPNAGYPETRQAVADTLSRETGLSFGAGDIVMTCGAAGAGAVIHVFQLRAEPGAGGFTGLPQAVDGDDQVGAAVLAFLEAAAHKKGVVGAGFYAQPAEHTAL